MIKYIMDDKHSDILVIFLHSIFEIIIITMKVECARILWKESWNFKWIIK